MFGGNTANISNNTTNIMFQNSKGTQKFKIQKQNEHKNVIEMKAKIQNHTNSRQNPKIQENPAKGSKHKNIIEMNSEKQPKSSENSQQNGFP
jgi:hypothetical protein